MTGPRAGAVRLAGRAYEGLARPLLFLASAQATHARLGDVLRRLDARGLRTPLAAIGAAATTAEPVEVGGVRLPSPYVVAAGFVKGDGFASEQEALAAVASGANVVPGWRSVPALAGPVEFGSFTLRPRLGNPGVVAWRDEATRTTRNRVGLRNPGARAAAAFLARRRADLPPVFGVNVAVDPGTEDDDAAARDVTEAFAAFARAGVRPAWYTLNLSCPNTEDDPGSHQTVDRTHRLCGAARRALREAGDAAPLWVKIGPDLSEDQYRAVAAAFAEAGVRAVVATNTLARPVPGDPALRAGVGGGGLHAAAVAAAAVLARARAERAAPWDVIGCGGVLDGASCDAFARLGIRAFQYGSALIYRGPLAAAIVHAERASAEGTP